MPIWWKGRSKGKSKANTKSSASSEWSLRSSTSWGKPPYEQEEEGERSLIPDWLPQERKEKAKSFDGVMLDKKIPDLYTVTATVSTGGRVENIRNPSSLGHPLPRPLISLPQPSPQPLDFGVAAAAGSTSASSVSSSGSSDDTPDLGFYRLSDPINVIRSRHISHDFQRDEYGTEVRHGLSCSPILNYPKNFDLFLSTRKDIHVSQGFNGAVGTPPGITNPRAVSCAPSVRGSPLSSPTGGRDDLRCPPHPLPLPPSSPSSPSYFSLRTSQMQWKKGKLLGRGTFGHVYLGFNRESGQMCAIKEVKVISDDSNSRESLKQLNQEINLLSQLSHPSIVQYYGSDLVDETLSIYIEYVSGGSIHKLLQEYGPFGEPVIKNYTAQILSGLAYLHGRNTVHRDIKGANILVDPNGEVKLADFGMAKHVSSCTSMRSFKGSPYWMAPEVIMNGSGYDLSVDIWSLGCTVLEMATSKPPWSQFEGIAAIFKIWNSKDIPDIPDHLSSEAKSFLKLCLQRDPSARPTASQLMDHPFVCDQAAAKAAKSSMVKDMIPSPSGRSYSVVKGSPINASASALCEKDYGLGRGVTGPLAYRCSSDPISSRTNTSLLVSPCSSPLWQYGPPQRSCFPSPAYPTYSSGLDHNGQNNYPMHKTRPNYNITDPRLDISEFRTRALYERPRV